MDSLELKRFIAVAGNIGVGKSTLVSLFSERLGWQPFYEPVAENPYLEDFYSDMQSWAFHSQVYFLTRRLNIHRKLINFPGFAIRDRSVYEDAEVFARNLHRRGHITRRDYQTYRELYRVLVEFLPSPDLVIYLKASVQTLLKRIDMRGRNYERTIEPGYLEQLNELYEEWISDFSLCPVLTIPADDLNYVTNLDHFEYIERIVLEKLVGKEEILLSFEEPEDVEDEL